VAYPAVVANPSWGQSELGYVPPPEGPPYVYTPSGTGFNKGDPSGVLGASLKNNNFPIPGKGFVAHHVKPSSWGGNNNFLNGVWIPSSEHQNLTTWWLPANFTP
jgi:hypothetical protein